MSELLDDELEPDEPETPAFDPSQISFFEDDEHAHWQQHWQNMPEFVQEDLSPAKTVIVHFENLSDLSAFAKLVDQRITPNTRSIWYPELEIGRFSDKRYVDEEQIEPEADPEPPFDLYADEP